MTNNQIAESLPEHVRSAVLAELDDGEELRWCGQGSPEVAFRDTRAGAILFVILQLVILVPTAMKFHEAFGNYFGWHEPIIRNNGQAAGLADGIFALLFGMGLCASAVCTAHWPWRVARRARSAAYMLTDTRIVHLESVGRGCPTVTVVQPAHPLLVERSDLEASMAIVRIRTEGRPPFILLGVKDGRNVERLIRATFNPQSVKHGA